MAFLVPVAATGRTPLGRTLTPMATALLRERLAHTSAWVFPANSRPGHITSLHLALLRIQKRSATSGWSTHDLRRSVASQLTSMGISRLVVAKILNHVERNVTAVYDRHSYDREKQTALSAWSAKLDDLANSAKVIPLRA